MAQIKPNINSSSKLELIKAVENLRYQLSQYETLLGVKPFIKEDLKGADFTFEMFTLEQLESLKLKFRDLSEQDKEELKGEDFIYEMFTPQQLENLKFRYEDFTQENLDYFRQPALDAAQVALDATDSLLSNIISLEIKDDLCLYLKTPDNYDGLTFKIENGNLIAIV